jgi:putative oxidoreductase
MGFLKPYSEQIYAAMRIVVGFLFLCHGVQKLLMGAPPPQMPVPLFWAAALIETGAGLLVMVGLFVGLAAFIASGTMAVAYFMAHFPQGLGSLPWGLLPINNQGEPAALYCFVFLYIAARGAGIWSVDAARGAS